MRMFEVFVTEEFDKMVNVLDKRYKDQIEKLYLKLRDNPYRGRSTTI